MRNPLIRILLMVIILTVLMIDLTFINAQAQSKVSPPAFYGGSFGYYKSFVYGDNLLTPAFFQDRRDGVVSLSPSGVFTYEQVDILKITGGILIKQAAPKFRVYLLFTEIGNPASQRVFPIWSADNQTGLYVPIVASVPLYQIGYNYTFQIIVHQELSTNALASQIQFLFEGVDL